ncbi:hypothetical protein MXB_1835 [Myxobolus squamalis]|nr:hypothetical protein MXB_1835 [Myxobolus squamalis]
MIIVTLYASYRKFEPFLLSIPTKATVLNLKNKIANIIGLESNVDELKFTGALTNKSDSLFVENALKYTPSLSESPKVHSVGVKIPDSRIGLVKLPIELSIPQINCNKCAVGQCEYNSESKIGCSCASLCEFACILSAWDDKSNIIAEMHRKCVNTIIADKIIKQTEEFLSKNSIPLAQLHAIYTNYVYRYILFSLVYLLIFVLAIRFSNISSFNEALSLFSSILVLIVLCILCYIISIQYFTVLRYYFQNQHLQARFRARENPNFYMNQISHFLQVVGEFVVSLIPNVA